MNQAVKLLISRLSISTLRQAKRLVRIVVGFTLLIVGLIMIITPGPATVIIPLALGILAGEFLWARWLLGKFNYGLGKVLKIKWKRKKRF